jgi:hypothetical protein
MAPHSSRLSPHLRTGRRLRPKPTLNHLWVHRKLEPNNPITPGPLKVDIAAHQFRDTATAA